MVNGGLLANMLKIRTLLVVPILTLALCGLPFSSTAQSRPKTAAPRQVAAPTNAPAAKPKQPVAGPFNGKLAAVDKGAKTITVGKRTFRITPETRMRKDGQEATLADAVVGEKCSGYVKPTEDGGWIARSVNFGPKGQGTNTVQKASPAKRPK